VLESLDELAALVETAGAIVAERRVANLREPQPRYLIGSGTATEIAEHCREHKLDLIVFDEILSPSQQRCWEKLAGCTVVDRQEIILDIFARRASTREATLQIDLARAEYMLPRLKRAWGHLHRQQGGVGVRGGEGEKQIEMDARMVRQRIAKLKADLLVVRRRRAEQRKQRRRKPVPNGAIVGYTNAGKSSLFNLLTTSQVLVENKLFATLDPTTHRLVLPNREVLLLTDTVGFIRKLPHDLVEAFKATLEEAAVADFLIHVVDASSPMAAIHYDTTLKVLAEIGAGDKPMLTVCNKTDAVSQPYELGRLRRKLPQAQFVSVRTGAGMPELVQALQELTGSSSTVSWLRIPAQRYELVASLHRQGEVLHQGHDDDAIVVHARVPQELWSQMEPYACAPPLEPAAPATEEARR
jgi:GTP-binding protein HflX